MTLEKSAAAEDAARQKEAGDLLLAGVVGSLLRSTVIFGLALRVGDRAE